MAKTESISDDKELRHDRGAEWCAIFDTLRDYRLSNMVFEGTDDPFCLVDLVSTIGGDISTGEEQLLALADDISLAITALRAANSDGGVEPVAFVGDYLKSDGSYDYYVMLRSGGREMSLHMHRIRGRAEYEAAEINSLFNGNEKPDFDDFDVDGPPANDHPPAKALDGIAVTDEMVERALEAWWKEENSHREGMRAALTAALK